MTAFATVEDLATILQRPITGDETTAAGLLLGLASAEIRGYCRQQLSADTSTAVLRGTWTRDLELPERPVTAVSSVEIDGEPITDWAWDGLNSIRRTPFDLTDIGAHWGGPARVVTVSYDHGFDPIPEVIRGRCIAIVLRALGAAPGVVSEQLGSYSVSYDRALASELVALTVEDRRTLRRYRRTSC